MVCESASRTPSVDGDAPFLCLFAGPWTRGYGNGLWVDEWSITGVWEGTNLSRLFQPGGNRRVGV